MKPAFIALLLFLTLSCKKENTLKPISGNLQLKVRAMHHSWGVPYLPIYLKKNATEWPGNDTTAYDLKATADAEGNVIFTNLSLGNYYLFGSGYDPIFMMPVSGYSPVSLSTSNSADGVVNKIFYVSE